MVEKLRLSEWLAGTGVELPHALRERLRRHDPELTYHFPHTQKYVALLAEFKRFEEKSVEIKALPEEAALAELEKFQQEYEGPLKSRFDGLNEFELGVVLRGMPSSAALIDGESDHPIADSVRKALASGDFPHIATMPRLIEFESDTPHAWAIKPGYSEALLYDAKPFIAVSSYYQRLNTSQREALVRHELKHLDDYLRPGALDGAARTEVMEKKAEFAADHSALADGVTPDPAIEYLAIGYVGLRRELENGALIEAVALIMDSLGPAIASLSPPERKLHERFKASDLKPGQFLLTTDANPSFLARIDRLLSSSPRAR